MINIVPFHPHYLIFGYIESLSGNADILNDCIIGNFLDGDI